LKDVFGCDRFVVGPTFCLVGGFNYFLFSPLLGEMIQFDEHIICQMGWFNHQLVVDANRWKKVFFTQSCLPEGAAALAVQSLHSCIP